MLCLLLLDLI